MLHVNLVEKYITKNISTARPKSVIYNRSGKGKQAREVAREYVLDYLSTHPCESCGESDIRVFKFHHVGEKSQTVSHMGGEGYSIRRLQKELERCQVLCANCHRKITI